ncbi:hypothetical protein PSYPI_46806, partial [Pseudomonas syringae pv. pisi str. 1704B]
KAIGFSLTLMSVSKVDNDTNEWSVLTELKQFMSSDYLLAGLGYDP